MELKIIKEKELEKEKEEEARQKQAFYYGILSFY